MLMLGGSRVSAYEQCGVDVSLLAVDKQPIPFGFEDCWERRGSTVVR